MSVLDSLGVNANSVQAALGGGAQGQSTSQPVVIPQMMDLYNQSLSLNQGNYNNILGAYSGGQDRLAAALPGIYQGYGNIQQQVQNTLGMGGTGWGVATPAAQAIAQNFAATQGRTQQDLINRGLGNSSILGNLTSQNTLNAAQAYGGLGAQLAQTYAGYQSQLGLAQQAAQMQGLGMQTGLSQAEGSTLGGYRFQSPSQLVGQVSQETRQGNLPRYNTSPGIMGGGGAGGGSMKRGADLSPYAQDNSSPYATYTQGTGDTSGYNSYTANRSTTNAYGPGPSYPDYGGTMLRDQGNPGNIFSNTIQGLQENQNNLDFYNMVNDAGLTGE